MSRRNRRKMGLEISESRMHTAASDWLSSPANQRRASTSDLGDSVSRFANQNDSNILRTPPRSPQPHIHPVTTNPHTIYTRQTVHWPIQTRAARRCDTFNDRRELAAVLLAAVWQGRNVAGGNEGGRCGLRRSERRQRSATSQTTLLTLTKPHIMPHSLSSRRDSTYNPPAFHAGQLVHHGEGASRTLQ